MRKALLTVVLAGVRRSARGRGRRPRDVTTYRLTGARIAFGQDVRIERDEEVTDAAVVVGGSAHHRRPRPRRRGRGRRRPSSVGRPPTCAATSSSSAASSCATPAPSRPAASTTSRLANGRGAAFGWLRRVRFGEVGRWLSLAGTLARVSVLARPDGAHADRGARAGGARRPRRARRAAARASSSASPPRSSSFRCLIAASIGLAITIIGIPFVARARADRDRALRVRVPARLHRAGVPARRVDRGSPGLAARQRVRRHRDRLPRCCSGPTLLARFVGVAVGALGAASRSC